MLTSLFIIIVIMQEQEKSIFKLKWAQRATPIFNIIIEHKMSKRVNRVYNVVMLGYGGVGKSG